MLLITDHIERSRSFERVLALWGSSSVVDVGAARNIERRPPRFVMTDIDLSSSSSVVAAHQILAASGAAGRPHLCILRDMSAHAEVQANAIGATGVLAADAPPAAIRAKIGAMLGAGRLLSGMPDGSPELSRHVVAASTAMADLLASATAGERLPVAAIDEGVASIDQAAQDSDLGSWLAMVRGHDDLTYQHCLLVSGLAAAFGRSLGFSESDRRLLTAAAVLHDVGKARIPIAILQKEGELSAEERAALQHHPELGHLMLTRQGGFQAEILAAVLSHHEYLDGSGYPHGLRGAQISDIVRMITICDIYAALIERRSYKPPLPPQEAFGVIEGMADKLDPHLLRAFGRMALAERQ